MEKQNPGISEHGFGLVDPLSEAGTAQPKEEWTSVSVNIRSRPRCEGSEKVNRNVDQQQRSGRTRCRGDPRPQGTAVAWSGGSRLRCTDCSRVHPRRRFVSHKVLPYRLVDRSLDRFVRLGLPGLRLK